MTLQKNNNALKLIGTDGLVYGFKVVDGKPRVSTSSYEYDMAEGNIPGNVPWTKIGYTPTMTTTESDVWSAGGVYTFCQTAGKWEVLSSDNTQDIGTVIKGDAVGNTVQSDAGGSLTTLVDADVDFTGATAVSAGDCIILDPHGTTPEWGYVTSVSAHTLTVAGGFSSGGTGASRYYAVVDKSAYTHAHAVKIEYLTSAFVEKSEIIVLAGTTGVDTVNLDLYRVNSFRVIAAGASNTSKGNITLRADGGGTTYSYITAGYTRARNIQYTVPYGKTLYINKASWFYGYSTNQTHYGRFYTRANIEPSTGFNTGSIFYGYSDFGSANSVGEREFKIPTKLRAGTDLKVSCVSTYSGIGEFQLKGWIE